MNVEEWVKAIKEDLEREDLPESYKKVLKVVLNLIESGDLDTAKEIAINLPPILE
ncbi:transcription factor [Acidianus brierleyi]|jgi:GTP cyclohydrolase I|uniref:Transcription factor n=1 Tax=Acidianus brierleyi TaxID=41673 RepID=A0A2U9IEJ9_9CREN|nr:transcription factor [Acidianus brierleyi]AWR94461.1 transcription factor [Acidianus brierleyi]